MLLRTQGGTPQLPEPEHRYLRQTDAFAAAANQADLAESVWEKAFELLGRGSSW
ncbi:hypothetical protein B932_1376 [Gluconobacter oxydans H24]|nr:hypothetical protein B932_1376 [Gluconobacter oxydans H24]